MLESRVNILRARVLASLIPLGLAACGHARAPQTQAPNAPPAATASAPSFAARAPLRTRLLFAAHVDAANAGKAALLGPLVAGCDLKLEHSVERIEVAIAEPAELRLDLSGSFSLESVNCVLASLKERGALGGVELEAVQLPHGVRVATHAALVDGPGTLTPLARRFDELALGSETTAVANFAPGGAYELRSVRDGEASLRVPLRSSAEAAHAAAWAKNAFAAEPSGELRRIEVAVEGSTLAFRARDVTTHKALLLRQNVLESFRIPSGSMAPTLLPGDLLFASKGPSVASPARGDVVVFASPEDASQDFVKRVIGVAGDHVELAGYQVRVNGTPLETALEKANYELASGPNVVRGALWRESLGAHHYQVLRDASHASTDALDVTVAPGSVFLLGDNRDNSFDSRAFGSVPVRTLKAQVILIWASLGDAGVRWERFGQELD
jgi:signal peptidase I